MSSARQLSVVAATAAAAGIAYTMWRLYKHREQDETRSRVVSPAMDEDNRGDKGINLWFCPQPTYANFT